MAADDFSEDEPEFVEDEVNEDEVNEDVEPEDLDEDLVEDVDEGPFVLDEDAVPDGDEEEDDVDDRGQRAATVPVPADEEDDDLEMVNEDDVEADLDTILKDRMTAADEEPEEDDEETEVDDRGEPVDRIAPKRADEFVCQSCFLLKTQNQLADTKRMLCSDCV